MKSNCQISSYLRALDRFGRIGQVHSVFHHSFNLIVDQQLMHVTDSEGFLSSFGLRITPESFQAINPFCQQGNVVKLTRDSLTFYSRSGTKKIAFDSLEKIPLSLSAVSFDSAVISTLITALENFQLRSQLGLTVGTMESAFFEFLLQPDLESENWDLLTNYFIGRGKGLTPSGDDLLMGYLFILAIYQIPVAATLRQALASKIERTTTVSQNYIQAMLAGFASSPFIALQQKIDKKANETELIQALEKILLIGGTSGKDTAYGMLLGLNAVKNR